MSGFDFLIWQDNLGLTGQTDNSNGDANFDHVVNALDLTVWETQFGTGSLVGIGSSLSAVPEPKEVILLGTALCVLISSCRKFFCER